MSQHRRGWAPWELGRVRTGLRIAFGGAALAFVIGLVGLAAGAGWPVWLVLFMSVVMLAMVTTLLRHSHELVAPFREGVAYVLSADGDLEIDVAGERISGRYVAPGADAPLEVGADLACWANPSYPDRVRVFPSDEGDGLELRRAG